MNDLDPHRKAFVRYLRYGTPIRLSPKQQRASTHYVWRTRGDGQVRAAHAAKDGHLFAWTNPPLTGHPGDAWNCRCEAAPSSPASRAHL